MNFDAYNIRDIQSFLVLLNEFEIAGVSDVRFMRQELQRYFDAETAVTKQMTLRANKAMRQQYGLPKKCPSCGYFPMMPVKNDEKLKILGCRNCRYSEVV